MATLIQNVKKISDTKDKLRVSIQNKGVEVGDISITQYPAKIDSIGSNTTAVPSSILNGFTAYVKNTVITGTIPTITNVQNLSLNVNENGLISSSINIVSGYYNENKYLVSSLQLNIIQTSTYIPTTSNIVISKNNYLTGDQIISGNTNLKPEYIKKGIKIFNVTGTYEEESQNPLIFIAIQNNSTIQLAKAGFPDDISLQYSLNNSNWTDYTVGTIITLTNIGDKVSFKSSTTTFSKNYATGDYYYFVMSGKIIANGNINSLINYAQLTDHCYTGIFINCISLITAPELPSITLANWCYSCMFKNCINLTTAPKLQAIVLHDGCYDNMFNGCTSLTTAPELPATILAVYCYNEMFYNCTSLTTVSSLSATNLANHCYCNMFYGCTNLIIAPELHAITLTDYCYQDMFRGCTNLSSINVNFKQWTPDCATFDWTYNISSVGIFICPSTLSQNRGTDYIPKNWTIITK